MPRTKSRIQKTTRVSKIIPKKPSQKCIQKPGTSKNTKENTFQNNDEMEDELSSRASTSVSSMEFFRPRRSKTTINRYSPPPKQAQRKQLGTKNRNIQNIEPSAITPSKKRRRKESARENYEPDLNGENGHVEVLEMNADHTDGESSVSTILNDRQSETPSPTTSSKVKRRGQSNETSSIVNENLKIFTNSNSSETLSSKVTRTSSRRQNSNQKSSGNSRVAEIIQNETLELPESQNFVIFDESTNSSNSKKRRNTPAAKNSNTGREKKNHSLVGVKIDDESLAVETETGAETGKNEERAISNNNESPTFQTSAVVDDTRSQNDQDSNRVDDPISNVFNNAGNNVSTYSNQNELIQHLAVDSPVPLVVFDDTPVFAIPDSQPKKTRKRKKSSSEFWESSDEDGEIDIVEDFQMPVFCYVVETHFGTSNAERPLTMLDYMRRATFMRIRVNERKYLEQIFRGYLLSEFDQGLDSRESMALNVKDVRERLNFYYPKPMDYCFACEKAGKLSCRPLTPALSVCSSDFGSCKSVETKPHMKYSNMEQGFAVETKFQNLLFHRGISRLPDLRLIGHNVNKLIPAITPKFQGRQNHPVAVHLCQENYGNYEYSTTTQFVSMKTIKIRPLFFYRSYPSTSIFQQQSVEIDRMLNRRIHSYFPRQSRKRRKSESPQYSKVLSVSPFGAFKPRLSRSVSPIRKQHSKIDSEPTIFQIPYQCQISNSPNGKSARQVQRNIFCVQLNGSFLASFTFSKTEQAVLMPNKASPTSKKNRFRRLDVQGRNSRFYIFDFGAIEEKPMEYLMNIRFNNMENPFNELRPESKAGAVLPKRMIYNYLRICQKPPKPIKWQKKPKKSLTKHLEKFVGFSQSSGYGSTANSVRVKNIPPKLTMMDLLKWLGLYCVVIDELKARYLLLSGYYENLLVQVEEVTIFDLIQIFPTPFLKDSSYEWTVKTDRIKRLIQGKIQPTVHESVILSSKIYLMKNKAGFLSSIFQYFKIFPPLKIYEIHAVNKYLEISYFKAVNQRFTENSDADSAEFESETEEIYEWNYPKRIQNIGKPKQLKEKEYSLGDFHMAKMRDPRKRDISNIIPCSKYLKNKVKNQPSTKKPKTKRLYKTRKRKNWDESSEEDENGHKNTEIDAFDDVEWASTVEEIFLPKTPSTTITDFDVIDHDKTNSICFEMQDIPEPRILVDKTITFTISEKEQNQEELFNEEALTELISKPLEDDEDDEIVEIMPTMKNTIVENLEDITKNSTIIQKNVQIQPKINSSMSRIRKSKRFLTPAALAVRKMLNFRKRKSLQKKPQKKIIQNIGKQFTIHVPFRNVLEGEDVGKKNFENLQEKFEKIDRYKKIFEQFSMPINKLEKILKKNLRIKANLPENSYVETNENEFIWRVFGADLDDELFENLLKNMEHNICCFIKKRHDFRMIQNPKIGRYERLLSKRKLENSIISRELKNFRAKSIEPDFEQFNFAAFRNKPKHLNIRETPFHLYVRKIDDFYERKKLRRSVSLPPKLNHFLIQDFFE